MKKPIIYSAFFFIITATSSFGQGVWIEENFDKDGLEPARLRLMEISIK